MDQVDAIEKFCQTLYWLANFAYSKYPTNEWLCTAKSRLTVAKNEVPVLLVSVAGPLILQYAIPIKESNENWFLTNDFTKEFEKNKNTIKEKFNVEDKEMSTNDFNQILKFLQDQYKRMDDDEKKLIWSKAKILLGSAAACKMHKVF